MTLLLDVGAGIGGPAAYAAGRTGVRPVLVEPEPVACRAAATALRRARHPGRRDRAAVRGCPVGLAWCLGVLCTAPARTPSWPCCGELRRIVRPGGRIGLLVYLAAHPRLDDPPQGNHFPASTDLHALLRRATSTCWPWPTPQDMPEPPASWQDRTAAVERELQRRFGHTPAAGRGHRAERPDRPPAQPGQLTSQVLLLTRE